MNHINPLWERFAARVIPSDATDVQLKSMKRCFFAGASLLFNILTDKIDDPTISSQEGARFMGELDEEISNYADAVLNGKA